MKHSTRFHRFAPLLGAALLLGCSGSATPDKDPDAENPAEKKKEEVEVVDLSAPLGQPLTSTPEKRKADEIVQRLEGNNIQCDRDGDGLEVTGVRIPADAGEKLAGVHELKSLRVVEFAEDSTVEDETLNNLGRSESVEKLQLNGVKGFSADGLKAIAQIPSLKKLELAGAAIRDDTVKSLDGASLEELNLSWTQVTDESMDAISSISSLKSLDLSWTRVTDSNLSKLSQLADLKYVNLEGARVTEKVVRQLKDARPDLQIDGFRLVADKPAKEEPAGQDAAGDNPPEAAAKDEPMDDKPVEAKEEGEKPKDEKPKDEKEEDDQAKDEKAAKAKAVIGETKRDETKDEKSEGKNPGDKTAEKDQPASEPVEKTEAGDKPPQPAKTEPEESKPAAKPGQDKADGKETDGGKAGGETADSEP